jgi:hypothetical protein
MEPKATAALAQLDHARKELAKADTLYDIKKIHGVAEAARGYAKAAHMTLAIQNDIAAVSLQAARKAGDYLQGIAPKAGRPKKSATVAKLSNYQQMLKDTDTPPRTATYWRRLAGVPERIFHRYVLTIQKAQDVELTARGLLREAAKEAPAHRRRPGTPEARYRKLVKAVNLIYSSPSQRRDELPGHFKKLLAELGR